MIGIGGDAWTQGAAEVSARTGVEIASFVIGPGRAVLDTDDDPAAELARVMEQILGLVPATAADGVAVVGEEHPGGRTAEELQATES